MEKEKFFNIVVRETYEVNAIVKASNEEEEYDKFFDESIGLEHYHYVDDTTYIMTNEEIDEDFSIEPYYVFVNLDKDEIDKLMKDIDDQLYKIPVN